MGLLADDFERVMQALAEFVDDSASNRNVSYCRGEDIDVTATANKRGPILSGLSIRWVPRRELAAGLPRVTDRSVCLTTTGVVKIPLDGFPMLELDASQLVRMSTFLLILR
jgi:hypothetical protein